MKKVYFGVESSKRFVMFSLISLILLGISVFTVLNYGDWYFIVLLVVSILLNFMWMLTTMGSIKTRIELDEKYLRGPYFAWYQGFQSKIESKLFYEELPYDKMISVEVIDVDDLITKKMIKALKIELKDSFPHVLLLDRFKGEELDSVIAFITQKVQKVLVKA